MEMICLTALGAGGLKPKCQPECAFSETSRGGSFLPSCSFWRRQTVLGAPGLAAASSLCLGPRTANGLRACLHLAVLLGHQARRIRALDTPS